MSEYDSAKHEYIPHLLLMNKLFFVYSFGQLGVNDDKGKCMELLITIIKNFALRLLN